MSCFGDDDCSDGYYCINHQCWSDGNESYNKESGVVIPIWIIIAIIVAIVGIVISIAKLIWICLGRIREAFVTDDHQQGPQSRMLASSTSVMVNLGTFENQEWYKQQQMVETLPQRPPPYTP